MFQHRGPNERALGKCLKIPLSDGYNALKLPDSTKEPTRNMMLPSTMRGTARGRARTEPLIPITMPLEQKPVEVSDDSEFESDASILDKEPEVLRLSA